MLLSTTYIPLYICGVSRRRWAVEGSARLRELNQKWHQRACSQSSIRGRCFYNWGPSLSTVVRVNQQSRNAQPLFTESKPQLTTDPSCCQCLLPFIFGPAKSSCQDGCLGYIFRLWTVFSADSLFAFLLIREIITVTGDIFVLCGSSLLSTTSQD